MSPDDSSPSSGTQAHTRTDVDLPCILIPLVQGLIECKLQSLGKRLPNRRLPL